MKSPDLNMVPVGGKELATTNTVTQEKKMLDYSNPTVQAMPKDSDYTLKQDKSLIKLNAAPVGGDTNYAK